jgi:hypothetical protein
LSSLFTTFRAYYVRVSHTLAVNVLSLAIGPLSALEALRIEPWRKLYISGHIAMTLTTQAGVVARKSGE